MKILGTADVHIGLQSYGRPIAEFGQRFVQFARTAVDREVDLAVVAGDLFHSRRPGPEELTWAVRGVRILSNAGIPTVIGPGNHDGMTTIADPDSHTLAWLHELSMSNVYVATGPEVIEVAGTVVCVLPYAHKRSIESTADLRTRTQEASRILEQTIEELAATAATYDVHPTVFVGHLTTTGASLGSEAAMQMGWDTTVDPAVFEPFDLSILGHIHVGQQVGRRAWYAGSPDVHAFGEKAGDKRFILWDSRVPDVVETIKTNPRPFIVMHGLPTHIAELPPNAVVRVEVPQGATASQVNEALARIREFRVGFVKLDLPAAPREAYRDRSGGEGETFREQVDDWIEQNVAEADRGAVARIVDEVLQPFLAE